MLKHFIGLKILKIKHFLCFNITSKESNNYLLLQTSFFKFPSNVLLLYAPVGVVKREADSRDGLLKSMTGLRHRGLRRHYVLSCIVLFESHKAQFKDIK